MAKSIDVTFIRHAESEDNLKVKALCEVLVGFRKGKLPSFQQLLLVLKLLEYDIDSNLSQHGKRQASDMSMILKTKGFWDRPIDCIVYSPLIRATETCMTIRPSNVQDRCICLEELREITPFEQLSKAKVDQKVAVFEKWLLTRAGDVSHVVVVGHCQCFNNLLGMKTLMRNCDVWRSSVTFSEEETGASTTLSGRVGAWAAPQLLHRSALSQPHPIGKVFQGIPALEGWSGWGPEDAQESVQEDGEEDEDGGELDAQRRAARDNDEVEDDLTNEPVCRICQARESETPGQRMLRPCLCSGSVSYVHLSCLNQWRATSTAAYFKCSVCRYDYNIKRTLWAELLMQESVVLLLAVLMVLALCFALGLAASAVLYYTELPYDPVRQVLELMRVDRYWMRCLLSSRVPHRGVPQLHGGNDFAQARSAIYSNSNEGFNEKLRSVIRLLRSPLPMQYFLCHPYTASALNVFLLGAIPVGCLGFFGYFLGILGQLRGGGRREMAVQVGFVVMWFASLGTQALSRLSLVVGVAIATREVYGYLIVKARVLSNWFGDMILEPHR